MQLTLQPTFRLATLYPLPAAPQIVLSGAGKHFCTGIDVGALMQGLGPAAGSSPEAADCQGRSRWRFRCVFLAGGKGKRLNGTCICTGL